MNRTRGFRGARGYSRAGGRRSSAGAFASSPLPTISVTTTTSSTPSVSHITTTSISSIPPQFSGSVTLEAIFEQCRSATDMMKGVDGRWKEQNYQLQ